MTDVARVRQPRANRQQTRIARGTRLEPRTARVAEERIPQRSSEPVPARVGGELLVHGRGPRRRRAQKLGLVRVRVQQEDEICSCRSRIRSRSPEQVSQWSAGARRRLQEGLRAKTTASRGAANRPRQQDHGSSPAGKTSRSSAVGLLPGPDAATGAGRFGSASSAGAMSCVVTRNSIWDIGRSAVSPGVKADLHPRRRARYWRYISRVAHAVVAPWVADEPSIQRGSRSARCGRGPVVQGPWRRRWR